MQCSQCQHENPAEAKFCLNCGTRLTQVCSQCQQVLPPEAKFCMACGHALTETVVPQAQAPQPPRVESTPLAGHLPEAERRQLTVMFCDLVGSTALSGQLDPEVLREVVRAYQEVAAEVIQRYDGHIAQYLGDGLLVYFGYPAAHEDDAQRAVRTGLGIIDEMRTLNQRLKRVHGIELAVRVGTHTGLVVIGDIGTGARQEQLALGETPNIAARIQDVAEPSTLVMSAETYRLTQGFFECESLREYDLRGVSQPITVYRVLGDPGIQSRLDVATTRGLTPLIGRESESSLLFERWDRAKNGNGQVILLSGEAGIGKSRLVQVLKDHVAYELHTRMECRSVPYFTNSALYPITDFLQRTLRFQPDDSPHQKFEKLVENLSQYHLPLEETAPLFGALLSLPVPEEQDPSSSSTPQRQRQKTLETMIAMILELAERQPVLFILEDLHWTDPSTLEFIELLIDQTPTASLYVLLTCRPEFQPSWSHRSYLTEMTFNRLSRSQIESIATQVAGGKRLPSEVVEQLADKTDGVPLYVEEMTKAVLASGALKEIDEGYELNEAIGLLTIPATLQDSLMARLDRLVTAKAVAQYASVIGRQFSYELLQAVSGLNETMLQHELSRLVEAELVYQRGLPPQSTYVFKHALIQDTAYESLLRSTRQGYHRRIATVLEERFPETAENQPELLAHHYSEAGLAEPAVAYWQRAGQRASERSAMLEAIRHFIRGLELLQTLPDTAERAQLELRLQTVLASAYIAVKGMSAWEVEHAYSRAYALCQQVRDTPQLIPVLQGLRRFYNARADYQQVRALGEQLLQLAQSLNDPVAFVEGRLSLGLLLWPLGELRESRTHLEEGIARHDPQQHRAIAHHGRDPGILGRYMVAMVLWALGYSSQAMQQSHDAITLAQELSHAYSLARALNAAILLRQLLREQSGVQEQVEALIALATEQGFALPLAEGTIQHGYALVDQGQGEIGIAQMREGIAMLQSMGSEGHRLPYLVLLAESHRQMGQAEEGLAVLAEGFEVVEKTGGRNYEAELYRLQGEFLLRQDAPDAPYAVSCFQKALDIARPQHAKTLELRAATSLARLWRSQGKRQEAYDLMAPVYDWFTEGFDTVDLMDARSLLDELRTEKISPIT